MNTSNLITLTLIYTAALMIFQRTEKNVKWVAALIAVLPIGYMTYQWGILRDQMDVVLWAAGIALGINVLFWVVWGRKHPPGSSDENIKVVGMDD